MMSDNIVKTRLTDEDKAKWQQFCHTNRFSEAKMLKMMINKIAPDIANVTDIKIGKNKYFFALHTDTDNPHVHLTVKKLGFDGKRLHVKKGLPQIWREGFAHDMERQGISS